MEVTVMTNASSAVNRAEVQQLYRLWGADDELLYIGISYSAVARMSGHRADKPWWTEVVKITVETVHCTREGILAIERDAILSEQPKYNVVHNGATKRQPATPSRVWLCSVCDAPIADGEGYIEMPPSERARYRAEKAARELVSQDAATPAGRMVALLVRDLRSLPQRARWHAVHRSCDEAPDASGYWIDIATARTTEQILDWTLHLSEKRWLSDTNWVDFVRRSS